MLNKLLLFFIFLVSPLFLVNAQDKNAFVGADVCGACHKTEKQGKQLSIWQDSKHSKAFETLKTKEADEIAAKLGHTTPAAETEACLKCHTSGYNVAAELKQAKFKMEDGVQCETCHGAGSEYKSLKVMKSREESIAKGLIVHEKIEDYCVGCHNPESPTFKEIDFTAAWETIKHPVPAEKK
ncbi:MAG: cytochrome c family protein [Ignavibacteriaceae bacterium]